MSTADTYTMTPESFAALRARAATFTLQNREEGLMFQEIILHLGHAFGLDPAKEDARLAALALETSRKDEDERLQDAGEALTAARAAEDAQVGLTPDQLAVRTAARTAEDDKAKADAVLLQEARDAEDARLADAANTAQDQAAADQQASAGVPSPSGTQPTPESIAMAEAVAAQAPADVQPPVVAPDDQAAIDAQNAQAQADAQAAAQAPVQEGN